ncbi:antibiotic biosynthesis monooxygenase family protein [Pseudomonas sp. B21-053]|uniref:antibiotic biosynthesis monooxygenase family protein n=1 Tax=Pseudomonas sp. B21-053 TaxID=2895493 RepID=UPI0022320712|nr:antibiotic biosynthesis monooxygenase family protein [Pseudomonas sp. B21-053]UZE15037.1 antibiotic biosynthesis monooxygenase [Pseudomonas sp. B21-053]
MNIEAVNTLEIRFFEAADALFERRLHSFAFRFEEAPGCLGYVVSRSPAESNLWILSGYWSSASDMTLHFSSTHMTQLVNALIEARANLTFASFTPLMDEAAQDEV